MKEVRNKLYAWYFTIKATFSASRRQDRDRLCVYAGCTYREKHDGDSKSDGSEDSQTHQQQHRVKLVHFSESVQQLCLHVVCDAEG